MITRKTDYCGLCKVKYGDSFYGIVRINPFSNKEIVLCQKCEKNRWQLSLERLMSSADELSGDVKLTEMEP